MILANGIFKQILLVQLFCITGMSFRCFSQSSFLFEHFTTEQGLSENFIYSIIQDSKGYLWIGTHDGLNRYDGYSFKKYRHNPADTNSLPNNTINSICEDGQGNIWIGTNGGLCRYYPGLNIFQRVHLRNKSPEIKKILTADDTGILVKSGTELNHINTITLKETEVTILMKGEASSFLAPYAELIKDKNGRISFAVTLRNGYCAFQYQNSKKLFSEIKYIPYDIGGYNFIKSWYYPDNNNSIWAGVYGGEFMKFSSPEKISSNIITGQKTNKALYSSIFEDVENNFWLGTDRGLFFFDQKNKNPLILIHDNNYPGSISSDIINTIYQDRTGIIWIGTANGLNKLNPDQTKFRHLNVTTGKGASLSDNFVLGLTAETASNVSIRYNFPGHTFSRFNIVNNNIEHLSLKTYDYKDWITRFIIQNPERLTDSLLNLAADSLKKYRYGVNPDGRGFIDSNKNLWYIAGSYLINLSSGKSWDMNFNIADAKMNNGEIWLASQGGGAGCFDTKTRQLKKYTVSKKNSISSNDVTSVITEENGNVWFGTKGGGLNYFDQKINEFVHYTEDDGLCNSSIYCIVKDNNGKIWIGTSNGLSCFDPSTKKFRNYSRADGLINSEYNRQSACKLPDGIVFMGGMNGIDYFHPDSLQRNSTPPQLLVTDFKVFDKNIEHGKNLSLKHDENFITLEFAAMDFTNPAANKFMYKLEGVDKDWIRVENRHFTTYSYLKPGSYRFLVKGANSKGVWNEIPAEYKFIILPAWYQTWWFISLVVLTSAAGIYVLFRYRLNQKLKLYSLRHRIHRDLHDDVGATLSSVKAYSELLKDNPDNPVVTELIQQNASEMIEKLEVIAWATNPQHDSFGSLLDKMKKFGYPICHTRQIELDFSTDGISTDMNIPGETRQNILLVFKEAINNTIKYSEARNCKVEMGLKNSDLILKISDDGKGMSEIVNGSGNGLKNMKVRAAELKGEMKITTEKNNGTTIELRIPYPFRNTRYLG